MGGQTYSLVPAVLSLCAASCQFVYVLGSACAPVCLNQFCFACVLSSGVSPLLWESTRSTSEFLFNPPVSTFVLGLSVCLTTCQPECSPGDCESVYLLNIPCCTNLPCLRVCIWAPVNHNLNPSPPPFPLHSLGLWIQTAAHKHPNSAGGVFLLKGLFSPLFPWVVKRLLMGKSWVWVNKL